MAIVNERHNPTRPTQVDPKTGKPVPAGTPARAASPTVPEAGLGDNSSGFFGSFFAAKNKKKAAAMEAPPPTLKASGVLSERENIEVDVISEFFTAMFQRQTANLVPELLISSYYNIVKRTMIDMVPKAIMLSLVQ
jgi:dynamin 1-like protein